MLRNSHQVLHLPLVIGRLDTHHKQWLSISRDVGFSSPASLCLARLISDWGTGLPLEGGAQEPAPGWLQSGIITPTQT